MNLRSLHFLVPAVYRPSRRSPSERSNPLLELDWKFFASRADCVDPTTQPIFVVGPPRSCTTLTEQILSAHPPEGFIIHCVRDPRHVAMSCFRSHLDWPLCDLTAIPEQTADHKRLSDQFDNVLPGRVHRLRDESMVDDFEGEVRRLLEYCGLGFDERSVGTPS